MSSLKQNTPEWEKMRKDKIGASDSPIIMNVSPYDTPYGLWKRKLDLAPEPSMNWGMERGHNLEDKARMELEKKLETLLQPQVKLHPKNDWMMASLDAMDLSETIIAEIKCPGQDDHNLALQGKIPDRYFPQIQHQLEVCQLEMGYYFSFDGEAGVLIKIYRDDKYIKEMMKKELEFYECIQNLTPPPLTNRDYVTKGDSLWEAMALQWKSTYQKIQDLQLEEERLRKLLISECDNQSSMGAGIKVMKAIRKGNVDYSKISELNNVNLDLYRKPSTEYWKISIQ